MTRLDGACPTCGRTAGDDLVARAAAEAQAAVEATRAEVRAKMEAADARIDANADGSFVIRLLEPVRVGGEEHARLTLERIRVRHARAARGAPLELEGFAEAALRPHGALDEISREEDYFAVMRATERALGKFRAGGQAT